MLQHTATIGSIVEVWRCKLLNVREMGRDEFTENRVAEFKKLFVEVYPSLCVFAQRYLGDLEAAKDVVQDVFIKCWRQEIWRKPQRVVKAYMYTAVKNTCIDLLKARRGRRTLSMEWEGGVQMPDAEFFLAELLSVESFALLEKAINTLPPRCAQIIRLGLKEYSTKEIAAELHITPSTVRTQKQVALKKLKAALQQLYKKLPFFEIFSHFF